MQRLITAEEVIAMNPCSNYTHKGIHERHGAKGITPKQISELGIREIDRFWVLIRLVDGKDRCLVAADIAESVLPLFESKFPDDNRPRKAIEATRGKSVYAAHAADAAAYVARARVASDDASSASDAAASAAYAAAYASDAAVTQWGVNFEIVLKYIEGVE